MASRELKPENPSAKYFQRVAPRHYDNGVRDLKPEHPFVISGGRNTERLYFRHINDLTDYKFNLRPQYFSSESKYHKKFPARIKEIRKKNKDAKIYCVFDWDTIYNDTSKDKKLTCYYDSFCKTIEREIQEGKVVLCPTMPCIEYWFLLHFVDTSELIKSCDEACDLLEPFMKDFFPENAVEHFHRIIKKEKYLEDKNWVTNLISDGKMELAIERAERHANNDELNESSYSFIYKIFKNK